MALFLELIIKHWQIVVMGFLLAILAGSGVYIQSLKTGNSKLISDKILLANQLADSQANIKQLMNNIDAQNAAVDKLKSDADARLAAHEIDIKKAKTEAANYKKQAQDLLNRPMPPNTSICTAADQLINEELQNAK